MRHKLIGPLIRSAREKAGLDRDQAAKRLGISKGYLVHLEIGTSVRLSEKLADTLKSKLDVKGLTEAAREAHNKRCTQRDRVYRKRAARASQKGRKRVQVGSRKAAA